MGRNKVKFSPVGIPGAVPEWQLHGNDKPKSPRKKRKNKKKQQKSLAQDDTFTVLVGFVRQTAGVNLGSRKKEGKESGAMLESQRG